MAEQEEPERLEGEAATRHLEELQATAQEVGGVVAFRLDMPTQMLEPMVMIFRRAPPSQPDDVTMDVEGRRYLIDRKALLAAVRDAREMERP